MQGGQVWPRFARLHSQETARQAAASTVQLESQLPSLKAQVAGLMESMEQIKGRQVEEGGHRLHAYGCILPQHKVQGVMRRLGGIGTSDEG